MDMLGEQHSFPVLALQTPVGAPASRPSEPLGPVGKEPPHSLACMTNQCHPDRGTVLALAVTPLRVSQLLLGQEQLLGR